VSPLWEQASRTWAATAFVFVWVAFLWLLGGVGASDVVLFTVYEVTFVALPGWVVYRFLRPEASTGERFAFGWALGYALEIAAFALTAAAGVRGLLFAYPALIGAFGLWRLNRTGRRARSRLGYGGRWNWIAAGIAVTASGVVAAALFPPNPLPGTVDRVTYFLDNVFQISLAAEALHHWPLSDPTVSGQPLHYHTFAHMLMAATAQVTGIGLPTVVLRLLPLAMVALFAVQVAVAGARLARNGAVGLLAALLVLFSGELDLDPHGGPISTPFLGTFFVGLWYSPTFLLGLLFFVPLVVVLVELVAEHETSRSWRSWVLFGLFLAAACGAKAAIPPVVVGGLALFLAVQRRLDRRALGGLTVATLIFLGFLATMYRGGDAGMRFDASAAALGSGSQRVIGWLSPFLPQRLAEAGGVAVGVVGLFAAPLVGVFWFAGRRRIPPSYRLLLCLFAAGLVPYFLIVEPGVSELFFTEYGFVAAALVSAAGIYWLWRGPGPPDRNHDALLIGFAIAWPPSLLLVVALSLHATSAGTNVYVVWAAVFTAGVLFFAVGALRARGPWRKTCTRLFLIAVLGASVLDVPLDIFPHLVQASRNGTLYVHGGTGLTTDLYRGLRWIRAKTRPQDVVAVSNYSVNDIDPQFDDVYYSAFAERRTFLEGWFYTMKTLSRGPSYHLARRTSPFPQRLRLNDAVFRHGDRAALRTLVRDYGVRYLVVDRVHGGEPARVARLGRRVFSNAAVAIFAVGPSASRT
jgi:hypothetical protein